MLCSWLGWLVEAAKGSSENASLQLSATVIANIEEWVHSEEEIVKNLIAIILVAVSTAEHYNNPSEF